MRHELKTDDVLPKLLFVADRELIRLRSFQILPRQPEGAIPQLAEVGERTVPVRAGAEPGDRAVGVRLLPVGDDVRLVVPADGCPEDSLFVSVADPVGQPQPRVDARIVDDVRVPRLELPGRDAAVQLVAKVGLQDREGRNLAPVRVGPYAEVQGQTVVDAPGIVHVEPESLRVRPVVVLLARVDVVVGPVLVVVLATEAGIDSRRLLAGAAVLESELELVAAAEILGEVRHLGVTAVPPHGVHVGVRLAAAERLGTRVVVDEGRLQAAGRRNVAVLVDDVGPVHLEDRVAAEHPLVAEAGVRDHRVLGADRCRIRDHATAVAVRARVLLELVGARQRVRRVDRPVQLQVVVVEGADRDVDAGSRPRLQQPILLEPDRGEEVQLVPLDRAAGRQGPTVVRVSHETALDRKRILHFGTRGGQLVELAGVAHPPLQGVSSRLGDHIDRGARHVSVLGRSADAEHLHLGDRVRVGPPAPDVAGIREVDAQSVDVPGHRPLVPSVSGDEPRIHADRSDAADRADAGGHQGQFLEVALRRRLGVDQFGLEAAAGRGARHIEDWRLRGHRDRLFDPFDPHREVHDGHAGDRDADAFDRLRLQPLERRGQRHQAWRKPGNQVLAGGPGHRIALAAHDVARNLHQHSGQRFSVRRADRTAYRADVLAVGRRRHKEQQNTEGEKNSPV